ncbi:hypothetical protein NX059_002853 [Plenodomus lindquistii]|nr:hypothetical protein NX059_002853 [Plenodomus lindquistii]
MRKIRATLRSFDKVVPELGTRYHWYTDAIPVDAIFPPGVPLSAKEILAYYPHHVRWKGVMLRLTANDYRGGDIMAIQDFFRGPPTHKTTGAQMNNYQRDAVKGTIPDFKTIGYKGKSTRELYTDGLVHGQCVDQGRGGFIVPTFNDLIRGLQHLPTGLDARCLTKCLQWYIENLTTFSPKLELNVLHVQALYRALRQPLRPFGPQNLDRNALREWQDNGEFEKTGLRIGSSRFEEAESKEREKRKPQLRVNLDAEHVQLDVELPLRHVLTFPFLAIQDMVGEMFRMGISKAEVRRAVREADDRSKEPSSAGPTNDQGICMTTGTTPAVTGDGDALMDQKQEKGAAAKEPYRNPKRPRSNTETSVPEPPSKRHQAASQTQHVGPGSGIPTGPRLMHPYSPRHQFIPSPTPIRLSSAQYGPPLSSFFGPPPSIQFTQLGNLPRAESRDQNQGHQRWDRSDPSLRSNDGWRPQVHDRL